MTGESTGRTWEIFARSMRHVYDYIGIVMVTSALWFVCNLPGAFMGYVVVFSSTASLERGGAPVPGILELAAFTLTLVLLSGPATAAVYATTGAIVRREETVIVDFFRYLVRHYWRSVKLTAANVLLAGILLFDIMAGLFSEVPLLRVLLGLWFWFAVFWALMAGWQFPLLVNQSASTLKILQRAALLTLDNLVVSAGVLVQFAFVLAVSAVLSAPMLLLFAGTVGFIHNVALAETLKKYEDRTAAPA